LKTHARQYKNPAPIYLLFLILLSSGVIQFALRPIPFAGPDSRKFLEIAAKQLEGNFWLQPEAFDGNYWSVGYPTFISLMQRLMGTSMDNLQVLHIALGLLLIVLTWMLAAPLGAKMQVAATAVVAFNPSFWAMSALAGYEVLLGVLIALAALLTTRAWARKSSPSTALLYISSGFFLGLAILVQSKALIVSLVFIVFWVWLSLRRSALGITGMLIALFPWSLRNWVVLGTANPFNTNGPINVWIGNNPEQVTGGFMDPPPLPPGTNGFLDAATQFVLDQPEKSAALLLRKIARMLEPLYFYYGEQGASPLQFAIHLLAILFSIFLVTFFLLYLAGIIWRTVPNSHLVLFFASVVTLFYLVNLPFITEARFMTPVLPLTSIVSLYVFQTLLDRWRSKNAELADHSEYRDMD